MTPASITATHALPAATPVVRHATVQAVGWGTYVVRAGDTLWDLATLYGTTVTELVARNGLSSAGATLHVGDRLLLPTGGTGTSASSSSSPARAAVAGVGGSYVVRAGDSLWDIATAHGIDVSALMAANGLSADSVILPGQRLALSGSAKAAAAPGATNTTDSTYVVRPGDSLWDIATAQGVGLQALLTANGLTRDSLILPGRRLVVPGGKSAARTATKAERTAAADTSATIAVVRAGDSLWSVANRYGVSVTSLLKANGIAADRMLHPGDRLKIVGSVAASAAAPSTHSKVSDSAAANLAYLNGQGTPARTQIKAMIVATARQHGVDPRLALAIGWQESRWSQNAVSEANAIGVMQCLPSTGEWVSGMIGRKLNLLNTQDNITCGVVLLRSLSRSADSEAQAIAGYYQGLASVRARGMYDDTKAYVASVLAYKTQM